MQLSPFIEQSLARGNITYAVDDLEFHMPVRETVKEEETELFVLLRGKMEPGDRFIRMRMAPRLRIYEKTPG